MAISCWNCGSDQVHRTLDSRLKCDTCHTEWEPRPAVVRPEMVMALERALMDIGSAEAKETWLRLVSEDDITSRWPPNWITW